LEDIKDGLLKMILFTNIEKVRIDNKIFHPKAVLKLTVGSGFIKNNLTKSQKSILQLLNKEAKYNNFEILLT